ncbi:MAG: hypothetical protein PHU95_01940 [Candidatus Thermoplasmatota archaeon]|nr:hypothetical protein [Candidatus Thermoplasmatota archaeon]MDD5778192.1 hypothetical protein [Candidatus Thermoplasmatota archaeon]
MGKYDAIKALSRTQARTTHTCNKCGTLIQDGEDYYKEHVDNKFLHSLHAKKFCKDCYDKFGDQLLSLKKNIQDADNSNRTLDDFV